MDGVCLEGVTEVGDASTMTTFLREVPISIHGIKDIGLSVKVYVCIYVSMLLLIIFFCFLEMGPVPALSLLDQTMEYSWVPLGMKAKLNENGTVSFKDLSKAEVQLTVLFVHIMKSFTL